MAYDKSEIGEFLSDQMSEFLTLNSRKRPLIEADCWDDEDAIGYAPLDRWGDAKFEPKRSRWAYEALPMTDWKA